MVAFIAYGCIIAVLTIVVGGVLLIIDNMLSEHRMNELSRLAEAIIPKAAEETKKLSIETINEINKQLYKQFGLNEDEES